jgi:agmatine/peptidylarginine deiminase
VPLPSPAPQTDPQGRRLPAGYANFLIINGAVIVPTYGVKSDDQALKILRGAFPERAVVGVDASVLVRQHGSIHCATMQIPREAPLDL